MSIGHTLPHIHHNLYRCLRPRGDSHDHGAELIAIYVALNKNKNDKWVGIFTDSQTILRAIQNQLQ